MTIGTKRTTNNNSFPKIGRALIGGLTCYDERDGTNDTYGNSAGAFDLGIVADQYAGLRGYEEETRHRPKDYIDAGSIATIGHLLDNGSIHIVQVDYEDPSKSSTKATSSSAKISAQRKKTNEKQQERSQPKLDTKRVPNHKLADLLMERHRFAVIENNLYYWNPTSGYYIGLVGEKADIFIRQSIPEHLKGLITFRISEEITQWVKTKDQLQVSDEILAKRKDYVAFINGIVRISDFSIHSHHPDYYFTSVVKTDYPLIEQAAYGITFEKFIRQVTGGSRQKYFRLQELFGYVISEIREVKVIPFLLGPKDSGKSIVLKILEHLIGQEFFTNLSFEELNQPSFLCQLFGKKLNACGEVSEIALNRLDVFKKLSGGDYVMARFLYGQAFKFINKSVLLFAGNDLPTIRGIDRSNAFSQRLLIFPFSFQVPKEDQDIQLFDKLLKEMPYIAKWSLHGLKRWCENNYQFTTCDEIEEIARGYSERNNSVKSFVDTCCILDPDLRTHNEELESAYRDFCRDNDLIEESDKAFHRTMQSLEGLKHSRFRLNDMNKNGYIGIGLTTKRSEGEKYGAE
jgi:putative DNA primase/helicase